MSIVNEYVPRKIRFLELYKFQDWSIKIYSITLGSQVLKQSEVILAKSSVPVWLACTANTALKNYNIATLILHQAKEGCFAIINWWVDENMLQQHVYLKKEGDPTFFIFSHTGVITCVWEMEVLWFERNAWINNVLSKVSLVPDFNAYLKQCLNKY